MQTFWGICAISNIYSRQKKVFVIVKIKQPSLINSIQYLKTYNMLHYFLCLFVKKWNLQIYSIAKIHYTTITMNKEGTARFVKKGKKEKEMNLELH